MQKAFCDPPWFTLEPELRAAALHQRMRRLCALRNPCVEPIARNFELRTVKAAAGDQIDANFAYVPKAFGDPSPNEFDPTYRKRLTDRAFELARDGYPWSKALPDS